MPRTGCASIGLRARQMATRLLPPKYLIWITGLIERRLPPPWSVERTEFNVWLIAHYDQAAYRQAQEHAWRVGNLTAVIGAYERLMYPKFRKWKRSQWWLRLLAPPELPEE